MNKFALIAVLIGSSTCGADADLALADRPHAQPKAEPDPATTPAALAWQASYTAENANNFEAALAALAQLPAEESAGYMATLRRAWLQYRLAKHADAVTAYNTAILLEPAGVEARVGRLLPLMALQKWPEVAQGAEDVLKRDPENYLALQRLAFAKFSTQRFPEAEQLYRHLNQLYPSDIEVRASLGWAVLRMGKQKEAIEIFRGVLEMSPKHAVAASGLKEATTVRHKYNY